jgi:sortase (surface protein transpeptidase)
MTARVQAAMLLAAMATGASAAFVWTTGQPSQTESPAAAESGAVALVAAEPVQPVGPRPVRIEIPAIGVSADLDAMRRNFGGELDAPDDGADAGWYADGVVPGDRGPAVIVGHLDSAVAGAAVFYRLPELQPGAEVFVKADDGATHRFVVDSSRPFAKAAFPTDLVYGPTALPELRLITCTGTFDAAARSYVDNLVVTAHAA